MVQKSIPKPIQKVMCSKYDFSLVLVDLEKKNPWDPRVSLWGPLAFGTIGPWGPGGKLFLKPSPPLGPRRETIFETVSSNFFLLLLEIRRTLWGQPGVMRLPVSVRGREARYISNWSKSQTKANFI